MVDAMPGCAWGWLRSSRAVASRAAQAGGLGKREAAEPAPCLSHQPGVRRCGINHLAVLQRVERDGERERESSVDVLERRPELEHVAVAQLAEDAAVRPGI